ncbi:phosphate transport system substrate-binding protein [Variovorax boronicumulans]|uniref:phosphate ABC transporter substrate-binding protein PstS n=1 Tax=Variovorax boronicumulans TaxID=436515 RepID=UPI003394C0E9
MSIALKRSCSACTNTHPSERRVKRFRSIILRASATAFVFAAAGAQAADVLGAGSTFVYPILSKWAATYYDNTGARVNYQSIGSGGGIAQIKAGMVTFGASDKPLSPEELAKSGLAQFPLVVGGVVPVVNVDVASAAPLKFTGPVLADIYLGKVTKWNDPAIAALNPGVALPDQKITVVRRSDSSGTTFNWVNYLSKASEEWKTKVGNDTMVQWPVGVAGKGNEGVATYVNATKGAIGYVELSYAVKHKMKYAQVKNKAGVFVDPNAVSFQAAAASAEWKADDFYEIITDAPGKDAWPIAASTFVLMYKTPKNPAASKEALSFFKWALESGQADAQKFDYVPLPNALVQQIEAYWVKQIK